MDYFSQEAVMHESGQRNAIRTLRRLRDLTQESLGHRIGLSQATICRFETGKAKPNSGVLTLIAAVLDVDPAVLADRTQ